MTSAVDIVAAETAFLVPTSGLGWCVLLLGLIFTGGGLWSVVQTIIQWVLGRPSRLAEIARSKAEEDRLRAGTQMDREKWIQDKADAAFKRLDDEFNEYRLWGRALRTASETAIDVWEPLVVRMRPPDSTIDRATVTVHVTEYLANRCAIHDLRESLR